jgi:hypothetical protein
VYLVVTSEWPAHAANETASSDSDLASSLDHDKLFKSRAYDHTSVKANAIVCKIETDEVMIL